MRVRELFPKNDRDWHGWFAWRPVFCYNDRYWVWLDWIERNYEYVTAFGNRSFKITRYRIPRYKRNG